MSSNKQEYTLDDGLIITVVYDDYDICRVTKECMELLIGRYEQGRAEEREKFMWCLEHFDYHMSREELIQKVKEFLDNNVEH